MKLSNIKQVKEIHNFLCDIDRKMSKLEDAEDIHIKSDCSYFIDTSKKKNPVLFSKIKHFALSQLQKDRQTALRKLMSLGVEV